MDEALKKRSNKGGHAIAIAVLVTCLGILVAVFWTNINFGVAVLLAERRPELLRDAGWEDPASAQSFLARFPIGSPASELVKWLQANKFEFDKTESKASLYVRGFPCNEIINIAWSSDAAGNLTRREAFLPPGGCL